MPRFVVLTHDWPTWHFDLLLENEAVLHSWRLFRPPDEASSQRAERIADHRLLYLDYEGPIAGNRGHVIRWDAGTYVAEEQSERERRVIVAGMRLQGEVNLRYVAGAEWTYTFAHNS